MKKRVIVVGAGVVGLFCALRLAQRGAQVTLLEAEKEADRSAFGPAASLAAAGMLAPLSDAEPRHAGFDAFAMESFELWRAQARGALWEDGVRFQGGLFIGRDYEHAAAFKARVEALGRRAQALTAAQWRKRSGFRTPVEHALFLEDEGAAEPARVLSGLEMDARRHGVDLRFGHDVETVEPNAAIVFEHGRFEADAIVLTPGVWATERLAAAAPALRHVRPARGHIAPVKLGQTLGPNVRGEGFYLSPRHDGAVLGTTLEFDSFSRHVDPACVAGLLDAAEQTLPGEVHIDTLLRPWVGVRPMTPDWAPMVGPSEGVLVACGHSRDGWLLAPVTADMICAHVFGDALPALWAAFTPDRFEGEP